MSKRKPKIAVVTLMRKGSKRYSNKVMAFVKGLPLYLHTVNFAKKLNLDYYLAHDYDRLDECPKWVNQIKRDAELSGDYHDTNKEILSFNLNADIYIFLQVTSPYRNIENYEKSIDFFINNLELYDCGFAAHKYKDGLYYHYDATSANFFSDYRDDNGTGIYPATEIYRETGAFYIFKKSQLYKRHILSGAAKKKLIIQDSYDIDINYKEDVWRLNNENKTIT